MEGRPLAPSALFHLTPDGRVARLRDGLAFANGIGISPDARRLYHNDSSIGTHVYDLAPDASASYAGLFNADGDCDGLAVDAEGGVWIANIVAGALTRLTPDGRVDVRIPVPGGHVTSLCFGGSDGRDVYATTAAPDAGEAIMQRRPPEQRTGALLHARAEVPGVVVGATRFQIASP
jgi:sugar lactone lactonase YvrE